MYCVYASIHHQLHFELSSLQVVAYEGEHLLQHYHDDTVITLLQTSLPEGAADQYIKARNLSPVAERKGKTFDISANEGEEFPNVSSLVSRASTHGLLEFMGKKSGVGVYMESHLYVLRIYSSPPGHCT